MSPERENYYKTKQRKKAFYIVENEKRNNEGNPPTVSAVIGLDKELEASFIAARRPTVSKKPAMETGIRVNRDITSTKKGKEPVKKIIGNRNGIHCPSLPTQWRNNLDIIIPKAEFGHFTVTRRK